jgi:hypothetical protein
MRKEQQKSVVIWHNPIPKIIDLILHILHLVSVQRIRQPEIHARKVLDWSEKVFRENGIQIKVFACKDIFCYVF